MAARIEPATRAAGPELVPLRQVSSMQMDALLHNEIQVWRDELAWDFGKSAELVRRFVDLRALNGCALIEDSHVVGYCYYVLEDQKGLIGDLYLLRRYRTIENEDRLLVAALQAVMSAPQVTRVEAQLMMLNARGRRTVPYPECLANFERNFMVLELDRRSRLAPAVLQRRIHIERWADFHQEGAAQLIAASYANHVDAQINDQYRSVAGARRFLYNIVQYPGCGTFFQPSSFVAFDMETGRQCGLSLASHISRTAGHITQVCVAPSLQGSGIGHELLRHSIGSLRDHGMEAVSLTVTAANEGAVELYERMGFHTARRFQAFVWEGFR